ncbi:MAG: PKD domain-containing protein [Dermatophilaceae bacterium]|nr:PKD domain-containing protein [Dermatophilaceae bacterium]
MLRLIPPLRTRLRRARRAALLIGAVLFGALVMPGAVASPVSAAPTFGSMNAAVAVIPPLAYGGVVPATVTFDGSGSYCIELCSLTSYTWNFGDGSSASGVVVSHTYTTSGYFTVSLTVESNIGLTGTAYTTATAFQPTVARFTQSASRGLMPLSVAFDSSGSLSNWDRPIVSYAWNFGDGTTGSGRTISHVFTTPGVRQVALAVTDSAGGFQTVGSYVYVQDPLLASTNLTATSPSKGVTSLTWTNRTVMISTLQIERCTGSRCTNFVPVSSVPGTFTSFSESGLRSSTVFRYRIRATDYLGNTAVSSIVSVKTR